MGRGVVLAVVSLSLLLVRPPLICGAPPLPEDEAKFIGWHGESYGGGGGGGSGSGSGGAAPWVELVSWRPRAFVAHNFMTPHEARHLRKLSAPSLQRSTVIGSGGKSEVDGYRTSYGTFLKRLSDPVVAAVDARVASWVQIPVENGEDMQVLRYDVDQYYKKHLDGLMDDEAGPRVATVLLYLSDVEEGGETAFPDGSKWAHPGLADRLGPFSSCAKGNVAFKPKLGDALLFWSIKADGKTQDHTSMHTGCPVLKGVKWTATKWIHSRPFRYDEYLEALHNPNSTESFRDPGVCSDDNPSCEQWARGGECEKNPHYMIGDEGNLGSCRKACRKCTVCSAGDLGCYNANRRELGYLELKDTSPNSEYLF